MFNVYIFELHVIKNSSLNNLSGATSVVMLSIKHNLRIFYRSRHWRQSSRCWSQPPSCRPKATLSRVRSKQPALLHETWTYGIPPPSRSLFVFWRPSSSQAIGSEAFSATHRGVALATILLNRHHFFCLHVSRGICDASISSDLLPGAEGQAARVVCMRGLPAAAPCVFLRGPSNGTPDMGTVCDGSVESFWIFQNV